MSYEVDYDRLNPIEVRLIEAIESAQPFRPTPKEIDSGLGIDAGVIRAILLGSKFKGISHRPNSGGNARSS